MSKFEPQCSRAEEVEVFEVGEFLLEEFLEVFEDPGFDLADSFAGDAEFFADLFQGLGLFGQ